MLLLLLSTVVVVVIIVVVVVVEKAVDYIYPASGSFAVRFLQLTLRDFFYSCTTDVTSISCLARVIHMSSLCRVHFTEPNLY